MPDFEERLKAIEDTYREIQDSLVVIAHLELRRGQSEQRNQDVDARIEKLVSAMGVPIHNTR